MGATGTGKSTAAGWFLAHQRLHVRPWAIIDLKGEELFDTVGVPPIRPLGLDDKLPKAAGLYILRPVPGVDKDRLEAWLWSVWRRGNFGLFVDEAALMPDSDQGAYRAILQQGRAKRIPVIQCTQRPVDVPRPVFSEANFFAVYRMNDRRDYRTAEGFIPADLSAPLPPYHWRWYDVERNELTRFAPVPRKAAIAAMIRDRLPPPPPDWHPFKWIARPTAHLN